MMAAHCAWSWWGGAVRAGDGRAPRTRAIPDGGLSCADANFAAHAWSRRPRPRDLEGGRGLSRRPPARATPGGFATWHDLAREAAAEHSRQPWLPDTGYGALAPVTEEYLRNLCVRDGRRPGTTLVVYCLRDCWMSWNAAKRILGMGYADVVWYPDGTDGWAEADLPLRELLPEP